MMILWEQKLAFLAVPKTGTTAIQRAISPYSAIRYLNPPQIKHMNVQKYDRFMRKYLESIGGGDVETMALMREPVSWLGSWYRYRSRPELDGNPNSTKDISFDAFVLAYLQDSERPDYASLGSQSNFLTNKAGEIGIDHLFAYEDFRSATDFMKDRIGKKLDFPEINVSPEFKIDLGAKALGELRQKYARDFEIYETIRKR